MRQSLTLLQRGVLQRLREGGYTSLADAAKDCWSRGEHVPLDAMLIIDRGLAELRADYQRADSSAQTNNGFR